MSVKLTNVSKAYNEKKAVDNISLEVGKGEILGFLGPNGAGKTTTMKMITCYLGQDEGEISVCGLDNNISQKDIANHIGYLPEHNPLYKELYVKEYLQFVAGIHKIKNKTKVINSLIDKTGIGQERNKRINQLSKGYRQRVGLAQAMMNDPDVLILDEPTSGLDPNQLIDIRNLIKELGAEKTVIFSTHIMQEVQALCDRVTIIDKGKLIVDESIDSLQSKMSGDKVVTVKFESEIDVEDLKKKIKKTSVSKLENNIYDISTSTNLDLNASLFDYAVANSNRILEMRSSSLSVEEIFQQLTLQN